MKTIGGYSLSESRKIAAGAARSYLRQLEIDPKTVGHEAAEAALDDLCRINSRAVAAMFWFEASKNQIRLFRKEWNQWAMNRRD